MKKKAYIIQEQIKKEDNISEVSGRALDDISLGNRLSVEKDSVTSIYTIMKIEAYRKSIETLPGMYGGYVELQLSDGPGCDFNEEDILFFE
jgi:hypothetical protein